MGNTSSEPAGMERQGGHKTTGRDSSGGAITTKDGDRPKILMDSPEDADLFHSEEIKAPEKEEFLVWQHDLEVNDRAPTQARPTVFRWTGGGKEVYLSGSFNNWTKLPLTRSHNNFVAILDLPEGEHQYKFYVDGQWTYDPSDIIDPSYPTCLHQKATSFILSPLESWLIIGLFRVLQFFQNFIFTMYKYLLKKITLKCRTCVYK
uniref:5'-AMP-activated protein kinase subunit beta-1 n=1 Tax=Monodelphis domestica TaxID=13616 RepID=A0A5F8GXV0_MONDO